MKHEIDLHQTTNDQYFYLRLYCLQKNEKYISVFSTYSIFRTFIVPQIGKDNNLFNKYLEAKITMYI
jgi:hypothetical protein